MSLIDHSRQGSSDGRGILDVKKLISFFLDLVVSYKV